MFKRILGLMILAGFIAGCNTMEGMGRDIERGGEKIQSGAEKTKEKM
jgi:predicted small secreted protein